MLLSLCDDLNAKIVVTSAWRLDFNIQQFNEIFDGVVIGVTPESEFDINGSLTLKEVYHQSWYKEVIRYIEANNLENVPWVVFDDQAKHFPKELANVFITDAKVGLTQNLIDKARHYLLELISSE